MNIYTDKNQENNDRAVANVTSKKISNRKPVFHIANNRPEVVNQRKLQEMANSSPKIKQLRAYQAMASMSHPIQLVLREQTRVARDEEGRLVGEYHRGEEIGDNHAALGNVEDAVAQYNDAINRRKAANAMHIEPDQGHLDAIAWLERKRGEVVAAGKKRKHGESVRERNAMGLALREAEKLKPEREPTPAREPQELAAWEGNPISTNPARYHSGPIA